MGLLLKVWFALFAAFEKFISISLRERLCM